MKTILSMILTLCVASFSSAQNSFSSMLETCTETVRLAQEEDLAFHKLEIDLISSSEESEQSKFEVEADETYTFMTFTNLDEIPSIRTELRNSDNKIIARENTERTGELQDMYVSIIEYESTKEEVVWVYIYPEEFKEGELQGQYSLMICHKEISTLTYDVYMYDEYKFKKGKEEYKFIDSHYESSTFELNINEATIYHMVGYSKTTYKITNVESEGNTLNLDVTDPYGASYFFIWDFDNNWIKLLDYNTLILKLYHITVEEE
jgi:hypothetical protein